MNTKLMRVSRTLCLALLLSNGVLAARADDVAVTGLKVAAGTIAAVDAKGKVLKVRKFMGVRTFVLGENCALTRVERKTVTFADFSPGEKVSVSYRDMEGVLVAAKIAEQPRSLKGGVTAIDPAGHVLTIKRHWGGEKFKLPESCNVVLNAGTRGSLGDIKLGGQVTVLYDTPGGVWTARQIEQTSIQFTGVLDAVNLADRTLSAGKKLLGDKQFHLAENCAIVINGKLGGRLQDLKVGETCELSYDPVDGVNIVNRIAPAAATEPARTVESGVVVSRPPQ